MPSGLLLYFVGHSNAKLFRRITDRQLATLRWSYSVPNVQLFFNPNFSLPHAVKLETCFFEL